MLQKKSEDKNNVWMLFDTAYTLVGQAVMETQEGDSIAVMRPIGENADDVRQLHIVLFSRAEDPKVVYRGEVGAKRGGKLYLELVTRLEGDTRRQLRVRMQFHSKLIRMQEQQPFRVPLVSVDLSGGGIAFQCPSELEIGEVCEVVVPVTYPMLVLKMQILRREQVSSLKWQYSAKFVDLAHEEESCLMQAIFSEQWRRGKCRAVSGVYEGGKN